MICDVAKYQGKIDWDALAPVIEDGYVAIKASGKWANQGDPQYARNVEGAVSHGVPFHAFHFLYCLTEAEAKRDAGLFYRIVKAGGHWPLFWVLDCEDGWGIAARQARPVAEALEAELRRLAREDGPGEIRVGLYIGHNVYKSYALDYGRYDYVWIPRYGDNDGTQAGSKRPDFPCDVWQYTSKGRLPGISGDVDLDMLIGDKPLGFFTGREDMSMGTVYIYGASIDENGKASGGKAGNQTGRELRKQAWYKHKKGWRVFRAKDPDVAAKIAQDVKWAVNNMKIGYDQGQRTTLYNVSKPHGFNCKMVTTACECDCSALVRVCCAYAGIMLPNFRTPTEPAALLNSGAFEEMKGAKYTDSPDYLKTGDILCTKTQGHTVIVGNDGSKAGQTPPEGLRRGDYGTAVRAMQEALLRWDAKCLPKYGADGDFGAETEKAVKAFQAAAGLPVTGVYDEATRAALTGTQPVQHHDVVVTGDSVNVRSGPGTSGTRILAVVHKGDRLPWQGEDRIVDGTAWHLIEYRGVNAWISGKFSKVC